MIKCDCCERIGIKINTWKQFEMLEQLFKEKVRDGIFEEIPVSKPYYIGMGEEKIKWYATQAREEYPFASTIIRPLNWKTY